MEGAETKWYDKLKLKNWNKTYLFPIGWLQALDDDNSDIEDTIELNMSGSLFNSDEWVSPGLSSDSVSPKSNTPNSSPISTRISCKLCE